jgi:hypothetical protein
LKIQRVWQQKQRNQKIAKRAISTAAAPCCNCTTAAASTTTAATNSGKLRHNAAARLYPSPARWCVASCKMRVRKYLNAAIVI